MNLLKHNSLLSSLQTYSCGFWTEWRDTYWIIIIIICMTWILSILSMMDILIDIVNHISKIKIPLPSRHISGQKGLKTVLLAAMHFFLKSHNYGTRMKLRRRIKSFLSVHYGPLFGSVHQMPIFRSNMIRKPTAQNAFHRSYHLPLTRQMFMSFCSWEILKKQNSLAKVPLLPLRGINKSWIT